MHNKSSTVIPDFKYFPREKPRPPASKGDAMRLGQGCHC